MRNDNQNLELLCKKGHNSPASRTEFIDINLDKVTARGTEQLETEMKNSTYEQN
ncbi:MAG TPA: hypothetical protein VFR94_05665 [Nitrososphaeraceae archaeon]|nr:hypothetical protein [Nitrososphaeraceae archaeon]